MYRTLVELIDDNLSDKNTVHSYLPLYENLLNSRRQTAKNVLEVGIDKGGSIRLWHDYFPNAVVHGVDIENINFTWDGIAETERIRLYISTDAYDSEFVNTQFVSNNIKFDVVLDDGPHTLVSMFKFIEKYSSLLSDDGILIIEDIQDLVWLDYIKEAVPLNLHKYISTYNLQEIKGRWDDIVFVIDKSKP